MEGRLDTGSRPEGLHWYSSLKGRLGEDTIPLYRDAWKANISEVK